MNIYHYLKTFEIKKGALNQSQCLKQAPSHIKNIYQSYYIGNEKDFIALLHYIKEKDNLQEVLEAIDQLRQIRLDYISTERIQFICEQSDGTTSSFDDEDEITVQAEANLQAYQNMFYQNQQRSSVV